MDPISALHTKDVEKLIEFYLEQADRQLIGKKPNYKKFNDRFEKLQPFEKQQFVLDKRIIENRKQDHIRGETIERPTFDFEKRDIRPKYFRTVNEIYQEAGQFAKTYPRLIRVETIGQSERMRQHKINPSLADGHDIKMLRLGRRRTHGAEKPKILFIGGIHAREITNPEFLMRWTRELLEKYGKDPQATWFLDNYEILVVPMMNPDGHEVVESGYMGVDGGWIWQRKNHPHYIDRLLDNETDENRNHKPGWGTYGVVMNPLSDIYPGEAAESESETKALDHVFATETNLKFFVDWHSYSQLVLYQPSNEKDVVPPVDAEDFRIYGASVAQQNGYTPQPGWQLYPTSGTTDSCSYYKYHVPSLTIETGKSFHMTYDEFQSEWAVVRPTMDYLVKTFTRWRDVSEFSPKIEKVKLDHKKGQIVAKVTNPETISQVEYVLDPDSVEPGHGIQLTKSDGKTYTADVSYLLDGFYGMPVTGIEDGVLVYVRAQDEITKEWGAPTAQWLIKPVHKTTTSVRLPSRVSQFNQAPWLSRLQDTK